MRAMSPLLVVAAVVLVAGCANPSGVNSAARTASSATAAKSASAGTSAAIPAVPGMADAVFLGGSDATKGSGGCTSAYGWDSCYAVYSMKVAADGHTAHFKLGHSKAAYEAIVANRQYQVKWE